MKKSIFLGLLTFLLVFSLVLVACDSGSNSGTGGTDDGGSTGPLIIPSGQVKGKLIETVISNTADFSKVAFQLKSGQFYIIRYVDGSGDISKGTIKYTYPNITFVPDDTSIKSFDAIYYGPTSLELTTINIAGGEKLTVSASTGPGSNKTGGSGSGNAGVPPIVIPTPGEVGASTPTILGDGEKIQLANGVDSDEFYYTLDGTDPRDSSTRKSALPINIGAINADAVVTLKAVAYRPVTGQKLSLMLLQQ